MREEWRAVPDYEGLYEVSSEGRVRRVGRACGATVGAILRQQQHNAYLQVYLRKEGRVQTHAVHRLVCYAFHGPPPLDKREVSHADDDGQNNRRDNLSWSDRPSNVRRSRTAKITAEEAAVIFLSDQSVRGLAVQYGLSVTNIRHIKKGKSWRNV